MDDARVARLEARTHRTVETVRAALLAEYGWTYLRVRVGVRPTTRTVVLEGEALLEGVVRRLDARLRRALPPGWAPSTGGVRILPGGPWVRLVAPVTPLARRPGPVGPSGLSTELLAGDGPVQLLARHGGATLVRAPDATVGWTHAPLGRRSTPPRLPRVAFDLARLHRQFRSYVGVPYRLGGTTRAGIDCSGLAQRAIRAAVGGVLPRHSVDQLGAAAAPSRPLGEPGDLVYLWAAGESPCHVGVVLTGGRGARRTVIHASSSRGRVVEEPLDRFLARADRVAHVELPQVLDGLECRGTR